MMRRVAVGYFSGRHMGPDGSSAASGRPPDHSRHRYSQILEYPLCKIVVDLPVPGDGGDLLLAAVDMDAVITSFTQQFTAHFFNVTYQVPPFHTAILPRCSFTISR